MANEAQITISFNITNGKLQYRAYPNAFTADVPTARGGAPGLVRVSTLGTSIDLSALTEPGLCWIMNLDSSNYVQIGPYDPDTNRFYPMLKLLPGEFYLIRLDPDILGEYLGTGTVSAGTNNQLRAQAANANVDILVHCFEAY